MNRYEFIEKLRMALSGKATQSTINENIRYYEEYLDTEIRKGRTESEVVASLGDPRLLAKTIVDAARRSGQSSEYLYREVHEQEDNQVEKKVRILPAWAIFVIILIALVLVFSLLKLVFRLVFPLLAVIVIGSLLVKLISSAKGR